jgi:hypothetical protein
MSELDSFGDKLRKTTIETEKDAKIERLENENIGLKDLIREQKFYFVVILVVVIDIFAFMNMPSWGSPVSITVIQIIALGVYAKKCQVDIFVHLLTRIVDGWASNKT